MNESIRTFLTGIAEHEGWPTDDETLAEIITDGKVVWSGNEDEHRHWIEIDKVVEVEGRFFRFGWAKGAGDQGIFDAGWEFDPETIIEVEPHTETITVTTYVPVQGE